MKPITKKILCILLLLAAIVFTLVWYLMGNISNSYVLLLLMVLAVPLFNMINIVRDELKKK